MNKPARYSLVVLASIAFSAMVLAWIWLWVTGEQRAVAEAHKRAELAVIQTQERFAAAVRQIELILDLAAQDLSQRDLSQLNGNPALVGNLEQLAKKIRDLDAIWLVDSGGRVVLGTKAPPDATTLAEADFFVAHARDLRPSFVGGAFRNGASAYFIPVSRRLERAGAFVGVLFVTASPSWLQEILKANEFSEDGGIALLTRQGNIVVSSSEEIAELDASARRELTQRALRRGSFGAETIAVGNGDDEVQDVLVGSRPIPGVGLVALYAVPYVTALQAWSHQLWVGSALIATALIVIIGGAILLLVYGRRQGDLHRMIGLRTAEAAQAAERLALAIDTTGIGIFDYRIGGREVAWAGIEPSYFGLRAPPALTPRAFLRSVHPGDRHSLMKRLRTMKSARDDTRFDTEFRLRHPEFGAIWVAARAKLFVRNGNGRAPGRLIGTLRDITERRRLQEHRETVLREINHRIKNSLQLMNSIMNLQSRRITSLDERARFESARRRLISLATVYAHLDDTTQPDVVDLMPFLRRLCQDFSVAYMADGRINLSFSSKGGRQISATLAVPLGMAMGEILVNISLTGFAPQATGSVLVNAEVEGDRVKITIAHNGRSVEDAFSSDGASLGRLLIDAFVDQLGGNFTAENRDPGLLFTLQFRAPPVLSARPMAQTSSRPQPI